MISDAIIENHLNSLESCTHEYYAISEIIDKIQKCIDEISLRMYSNMNEWVDRLDQRV